MQFLEGSVIWSSQIEQRHQRNKSQDPMAPFIEGIKEPCMSADEAFYLWNVLEPYLHQCQDMRRCSAVTTLLVEAHEVYEDCILGSFQSMRKSTESPQGTVPHASWQSSHTNIGIVNSQNNSGNIRDYLQSQNSNVCNFMLMCHPLVTTWKPQVLYRGMYIYIHIYKYIQINIYIHI